VRNMVSAYVMRYPIDYHLVEKTADAVCRIISLLLFLSLILNQAFAASSFNFQRYDTKSNQLYMQLVTPTTQGDVLLKVGEEMTPLKDARLEGLFMLRVQVPCEVLKSDATLYWATAGNPLLRAQIPPQDCHFTPDVTPITIFDRQGECWLNIGNNTLWRVATEMSKRNKVSIYQNVYALFLANRTSFIGEDINRLKTPLLKCPSDQLIEQIPPSDAHRLFKEMLEFNKQS